MRKFHSKKKIKNFKLNKNKKKQKKFLTLVKTRSKSFKNKYNCKANIHECVFVGEKITNVNFRGAIVTNCNFRNAILLGVDFIGTNLTSSRFKNADLSNVIFCGTKLDGCDFTGATFNNVVFVNTDITKAKNLDINSPGIFILKSYPIIQLNKSLKESLTLLSSSTSIYQSHVLHTNKRKINSLSLYILTQKYSQNDLTRAFQALSRRRNKKDFFTVYSIELFLKAYLKL